MLKYVGYRRLSCSKFPGKVLNTEKLPEKNLWQLFSGERNCDYWFGRMLQEFPQAVFKK
jgi:hypothetical protein